MLYAKNTVSTFDITINVNVNATKQIKASAIPIALFNLIIFNSSNLIKQEPLIYYALCVAL